MYAGLEALRFVLATADPRAAAPAIDELREAILAASGVQLEPHFVTTYAELEEALSDGQSIAWTPPLVACDLITGNAGAPLVTIGRHGMTSYHSVLLTQAASPFLKLEDLAAARAGWVSKLSAAGYVIPRLYLRSLGFEPRRMFATDVFLGSHARVAVALQAGEIDVAATFATTRPVDRRLEIPERFGDARVLAAAGPIPGDVIFSGAAVHPRMRDRVKGAFLSVHVPRDGALARFMNVDRFEVTMLGHFDLLRRWRASGTHSSPPPPLEPQRG
jgi:ABC-type phosphate/phosphonate transport system substrate-binding protein